MLVLTLPPPIDNDNPVCIVFPMAANNPSAVLVVNLFIMLYVTTRMYARYANGDNK